MDKIVKILKKRKYLFCEWANYVAWDSSGGCKEFEYKPTLCEETKTWVAHKGKGWYIGSQVMGSDEMLDDFFDEDDWKESLFCLKSMSFVNQ